jgi:hypothetical protein
MPSFIKPPKPSLVGGMGTSMEAMNPPMIVVAWCHGSANNWPCTMLVVGLDVVAMAGRSDETVLVVAARRGGTSGVGGVAKPPKMARIWPAAVAGRDRWLHVGRNNAIVELRVLGLTFVARCFTCARTGFRVYARGKDFSMHDYAAFAGAHSNPTARSGRLLQHAVSHVANILCGALFYACAKDFSTEHVSGRLYPLFLHRLLKML